MHKMRQFRQPVKKLTKYEAVKKSNVIAGETCITAGGSVLKVVSYLPFWN